MTQKLTFYAGSLPHFSSRLAPLWKALPEPYRGPYYARGRSLQVAIDAGVEARAGVPKQPERELCIVASHEDYRAVRPAKVIMVAHGVGQTYVTGKGINHPSYSGGNNRDRVVLNICAGEYDAQKCRDAGQEAIAVGPFHLDSLGGGAHGGLCGTVRAKPTIAFSAHTDAHVVPETRWAWPEYQPEIIRIIKEESYRFNFIGHCHPRMWSWFRTFWPKLKVPFETDFLQVMKKADCYVSDNSSSLYEACALLVPTVVLNASYYRRDVEHGLRFWSDVPGPQVNKPDELLPTICDVLDWRYRDISRHAASVVYSDSNGWNLADGQGTKRAIAALVEFLDVC